MKLKNACILCVAFLLWSSFSLFAQKVGLVLSGGGARGLAHIGAIKALEENHIPIDFITGTSAGAIVGCMYSMGFTPDQMDSIVHTDEFYNWANGIINEDYTYYFRKPEDNASWIGLKFSLDSVISTTLPTAIVSSAPYDYALMENCAAPIAKAKYNFDSLFVPFRCVAADIENKKTILFRNGDLATAVRASSAYPFYFKPIVYEGKILYDGGMYNNFPIDVMLSDFQPDIIIGVNAAGTNTPTSENNIISQIRAMMTTPTSFSVVCENGILIEANTDRFGLFDFNNISAIIEEGYESAKKQMDRIQFNIQRRSNPDSMLVKRSLFRNGFPKILIDSVIIEGLNTKQSGYVRKIIKPTDLPLSLEKLKDSYFQLLADPNIKSIYPSLALNEATGYFDLRLKIMRDKDLSTHFGGNLSSKPVSEAYVGIHYNIWNKRSYRLSGNFYFGKLYTGGQFKARMDVPGKFRYFLEAEANLNQYDFFRSSNQFFIEQKPTYILKSEQNYGLNLGIPVKNKGKIVFMPHYLHLRDDYYQTENFLSKDTADESILRGFSSALLFEKSSLNRKQYASQGSFLSAKIQYVNLEQLTIPGSTSLERTKLNNYVDWFQFRLTYENYFQRIGPVKLGVYGDLSISNMPFLANYTVSVLNSPSFAPIQEARTIYQPIYHAHNFGGIGLKSIIAIRSNIEWRMEAYLFTPQKEILATGENKAKYGPSFSRRIYCGSVGPVFHSPLGPIGVFVNYFEGRKDSFSFLFHFGYFIFNRNSLN